MSSIGTLWGDVRQRQTKVILSIAALNGFELNQPPFSFEDKPADFTEKFPYGKIPAFESTNGFKLIEGTTIARYVSSIGELCLLGANAEDTAIVDQWIHYAEHELLGPNTNISGLIRGATPFSREALDKHSEDLFRALKYLESHLESARGGYVALNKLTLADLVVASFTYTVARLTLGAAERKQFPRIFEHYSKVTGDKRIQKYWGTDGFVDVRVTEPKSSS